MAGKKRRPEQVEQKLSDLVIALTRVKEDLADKYYLVGDQVQLEPVVKAALRTALTVRKRVREQLAATRRAKNVEPPLFLDIPESRKPDGARTEW